MPRAQEWPVKARRHAIALGVVVAAHVALGIWVARVSMASTVGQPYLIALDLSPGPGGFPAPMAVGGDKPSSSDGVAEVVAETNSPKDEAEKSPAEPLAAPDMETASVPRTEIISLVSSVSENAATTEDILKMVEALVGTTVTDHSAPESPAQAMAQQTWNAPASGAGGGCGLEAAIQTRLMGDRAALKELADFPVSDRSVANAIHVWNGGWLVGPDAEGTPNFEAVRQLISQTVEEAEPRCQTAAVSGPRFLLISYADSPPLIMVLGSGVWRWSELKAPNEPSLLRWFGLGRRP